MPLLPFLVDGEFSRRAAWSTALTLLSLFGVGAARATLTEERWWRAGMETLSLGAVVAAAAYVASAVVAAALQ